MQYWDADCFCTVVVFESRLLFIESAAANTRVRADPTRIRQVFWNLLRNAVKFTPSGGEVEVRTSNPGQGEIQVLVNDSGIGMDPDQIERLFQPFEQIREAAHGGLGFGLAIAKSVVDAHGGSIAARSEGPEQGSTFIVTLPTLTESHQAHLR